jgi:hypothetical protein
MRPVILTQCAMIKHSVEIGENDRAAHEERSQHGRAEPGQDGSAHCHNDNPNYGEPLPKMVYSMYIHKGSRHASAHIQMGQ